MNERTRLLQTVEARAATATAHRNRSAAELAARNAAMAEAYEAGCTLAEIATAAGVSLNAVSLALGRPAGGKRHTPLEPAS